MDLKNQAIKGVKWVSVATVINSSLQFLLIVILSRFLSKSDFGLMALANVIIEFSSYFIDMGFSNLIIHKQNITHIQLSSIYWLSILTGIVIFLIIFLLSPVIAAFYKSPELNPLIKFISLTFIIIPFGQQHKMLLQKDLKFNDIAKIDVSARVIAFALAVTGGVMGLGVYALAVMVLATSIISTILYLVTGLKVHRPSFKFSHSSLKTLYSFGSFQLGEESINYFGTQFDTIIIGKILGTEALGIYTIAKNLVMRPSQIINPIVTRVTFPLMSKFQDNKDLLKKTYTSTINYLSSINFPIHLVILILAEPLINILFTKTWSQAIVIVKILALFSLVSSTFNPIGSLMLAKGRADLGFYWVIFFTMFSLPIVYAGTLLGLQGVSYSQLFLFIIVYYPFYRFIIRRLN